LCRAAASQPHADSTATHAPHPLPGADEASPTYVDMLDNTAVGQRAILENFGAGALPRAGWQIGGLGRRRRLLL
jgi:hypothetical protein